MFGKNQSAEHGRVARRRTLNWGRELLCAALVRVFPAVKQSYKYIALEKTI
jgi:hypothetical protein